MKKKQNSKYFYTTVGIFRIFPNNFKKRKKRKHTNNFKIKLKQINIKKPISGYINVEAVIPSALTAAADSLVPLIYCALGTLNILTNNGVNIHFIHRDTDKFYFQAKASIKINLFLLISSVLQTITLSRR